MKIIIFSSYTSTWTFALAEAIMANAFQKKGHQILYITSGDQLIGKSDLFNENILRREFGLNGYTIGDVLTDQDRKEISLLMNNVNKNNVEDLVIDGVNIGKIALYELLLHRKKMTLDFTDDEWVECLVDLKNTLTSFFACRSIMTREKPNIVMMYNTLYSVNHAWERCANSKRIPVYFIHHGVNVSDMDNTLIVARDDGISYINELKNIWPILKDIPVPQMMLRYVTDHFLELLKAKHYLVYSAPKRKDLFKIRDFFAIRPDQKILTATMSSYDEMFAAEYVGVRPIPLDLIFASQTDWIIALIAYVKSRPDLFLLIRVHPREFPNKRDSVKSEHATMLENHFKDLPNNIKINWPKDNVSLYDISEETDVFLNAWSAAGIEMSLLGVPVVIYSEDLISYPGDLNYLAKNYDDYFNKIELAIKKGWDYQNIKMTYRWLTLYYYRTIIRLRNKTIKDIESPDQLEATKSTLIAKIVRNIYHIVPKKIRLTINKMRRKRRLMR